MSISPLKGAMLTERNQSSASGPMTIKCLVCLPEGLYILKLKIDKAMKTQSSIRPNQFSSNSYNTCIYRYKINISFLAGQSLREKQALPCEVLDGKEAYTHGKGFAVRARTA
jgi:hypothetical protein